MIFHWLFLSTALCQETLNTIISNFKQYHQRAIKEKLFVSTDKNFYIAGEIAWFKLYSVDAYNHKPLELSKVAYIELLDSANRHILQAKIALNNAEGNGSFYLPLTINSGNYKLRAYTNWMKNFDADYFFEKMITVVNVQKTLEVVTPKSERKEDIEFFPEGGNLVNNIQSKVAFKGSDQYGRGINFTGLLLDNTDTLLRFNPKHAGMGAFSFTPVPDHSYKAAIRTASGQSIVKDLPGAYTSGYVMHLTDSAGKIAVTVQSDISSEQLYLFAHTREMNKVTATNFTQNGKTTFFLDKDSLGDGVSHITVFNGRKQPVCERLYFKKPHKHLNIKISANQPLYAIRKKVSLAIHSVDTSNAKNDSASLSMSVYRLDSLQTLNSGSIESYLLLTSDLKGFVEDPDYYFANNDMQSNTFVDYLMLTNGWRRFKWEEILNSAETFFKYIPEYNGLLLTGKVINTSTGSPAKNIETFISAPGFQNEFKSSVSDENGGVAFELKDLYGSTDLFLQTNSSKDSAYRVDVTNSYADTYTNTTVPQFTLQKDVTNTLLEQSVGMQVQNIYLGKYLKRFSAPFIDTTAFYISPDAKYLLDDYTRFTTIEEILREYVRYVELTKRDGRFHFGVQDIINHEIFKTDPLVLLDGVPVFDYNKFMQLDPLKLNKLEVVNRKYFLGPSLFNGILSWTSYKKDMANYEPDPHTTVIDFDGLQLEREFYSPVYMTDDQESSHIPDFRSVLLWSPSIKIAPGKTREMSFYTSDIPGKYVVQIQGLSKNGSCGSKVITFEVSR